MTLRIIPLDLAEANELVARWHRHHKPTVGDAHGPEVTPTNEDR